MIRLSTSAAESLYEEIRNPLRGFLGEVDTGVGLEDSPIIRLTRDCIRSASEQNGAAPDEFFNDLYVLERYVDFFECYGQVWKLIAQGRFTASWSKLQDSLDFMRLVRRFSNIDIGAFEEQLLELEKTYPYNVFLSIGALVERFECSICGNDIDSFECIHRKGQLYRGRMAVGIAKNIVQLDHIAMVDKPQDRRCVVTYEDTGEQFKLVRLLSELLTSRTLLVSDFGVLVLSKRRKPNPEYRTIGRSDEMNCAIAEAVTNSNVVASRNRMSMAIMLILCLDKSRPSAPLPNPWLKRRATA